MPQDQVVVSAQVPVALAERLRQHAAADDRTVSYALRQLLQEALNDNGGPRKAAEVKASAGTSRHGQV
jgi:hypothetical protein